MVDTNSASFVPTLAQLWDEFVAKVIPADAPEIQRKEMRRAYYAGAHAALTNLGRCSRLPKVISLAVVGGMQDELQLFNADVQAGKA